MLVEQDGQWSILGIVAMSDMLSSVFEIPLLLWLSTCPIFTPGGYMDQITCERYC